MSGSAGAVWRWVTASSEAGGRRLPRLHLVTDDGVLAGSGFFELADTLLDAGGPRLALHLRGHRLPARNLWTVAARLTMAAGRSGSWLLVNDRVDVALACGAHGVQLGQRSMGAATARGLVGRDRVIGVSVHDHAEAAAAVAEGADFLLAGTLFPTRSHPGGGARGTAWLPGLVELGRPVIGIGGIDVGRVAEVVGAGAHGVAVISAVWGAADPAAALELFLAELE